ncbi:MAG: type I-E CRISPR-associated protein Cas5/CasD [Anaerolineaceae bacterium]|nr:type I-E CRISPR-associated protein Cas5/CasD [Anaerolineaceae bacterium]
MPTLLLQCVAPLQSWDTQSRFGVRATGREPSKSGVVGLLCAALGRPRTEPVDDLATLRMGVRVDKEGQILRDWHTAGKGGYLKASGSVERKNLITSTRYYLSDAAFLVGLESDDLPLLKQLHAALSNPHWMLFLGRKACPPSLPPYLADGLKEESGLLNVLAAYPWLGRNQKQYDSLIQVRVVLEDDAGSQVFHDHPISFEKGNRQFAPRRASTTFIEKPPFHQVPGTSEVPGTLSKEEN